MQSKPTIITREQTRLSPWTTVVTRTLLLPGNDKTQEYHSLKQADYVCVLAETVDGRIPLVRQYRPAIEAFTLEFPAGLRDGDEPPEQAALRELAEETGLEPLAAPHRLGCLSPDVGRLENKLWAYMVRAGNETAANWQAEPGVERLLVTKSQLREWILDGNFNHALHIALIGIAMLQGRFTWET